MNVEVHLIDQAQPITRREVRNTYQKGTMFCIMFESGKVEKYPMDHIFRVVEG